MGGKNAATGKFHGSNAIIMAVVTCWRTRPSYQVQARRQACLPLLDSGADEDHVLKPASASGEFGS
jgi:hypothetical protein